MVHASEESHGSERRRRLMEFAGDLAVWPGLYAGGVLWLLAWIAGFADLDARFWLGTLFVGLCSQAGYLLDRVKARPGLLDPADAAAQPGRSGFTRKHQRWLRLWIGAELLMAACVAWLLSPWLALVPIGTGVGVMMYAGRPAGTGPARPKDWPMVKGIWVAAAHTALACATLLAARAPFEMSKADVMSWALSALAVGLVVFGDALICDLDDLEADRSFGTRSVPVLLGTRATWAIAWASAALGALLASLNIGWRSGLLLGGSLIASYAIARVIRVRRDFIDARLAAIAVACVLLA